MNNEYSGALVWFRRDLRLSDNPALSAAVGEAAQVTPVYLHCQHEEAPWAPGAASNWWLHHSIADLQMRLEKVKMKLIVRSGDNSLAMLKRLIEETGAGAVYWNRLYEPAIADRDARIEKSLLRAGIEVNTFNAALLTEPGEVATGQGKPYKVFTPYYKACRRRIDVQRGLRDSPGECVDTPTPMHSAELSELGLLPAPDWAAGFPGYWVPGETGAVAALARLVESDTLLTYETDRDFPHVDGVSRLSPHLHFGELSPARVWHEVCRQAAIERQEDAVEPFLRQLVWRDFAHHLLFHFPHTVGEEFNPRFGAFPWRQSSELFEAWTEGATGIPLVDAGMRQLWQTGWMHNRVRMVVASFLTKHCLTDWRLGLRWFWDTLVDADLANNTMGWQWAAGCGADAAPFFRIFNPVRQGLRFDPQGEYVRHWVPELAHLGPELIHQPWKAAAPGKLLREAGKTRAYPEPVVDLTKGREAALHAYRMLDAGRS